MDEYLQFISVYDDDDDVETIIVDDDDEFFRSGPSWDRSDEGVRNNENESVC